MNLESIDPEEGLKLLEAKKDFGQLFCFTINGVDVICRPLSIAESGTIAKIDSSLASIVVEDWILSKCLVYCSLGKDYLINDSPAFIATGITRKLLEKSTSKGEVELKSKLEAIRQETQILSSVIESAVLSVFKNITITEFNNMTENQQLYYLALSENILGKKIIEEEKIDPKTGKPRKRRSAEANRILSKEAADKPDFEKDNAALGG